MRFRADVPNVLGPDIQTSYMEGLRGRIFPVRDIPIRDADFIDLDLLHGEEGFLPALLLFRRGLQFFGCLRTGEVNDRMLDQLIGHQAARQ